jgi:hypothetical protein
MQKCMITPKLEFQQNTRNILFLKATDRVITKSSHFVNYEYFDLI